MGVISTSRAHKSTRDGGRVRPALRAAASKPEFSLINPESISNFPHFLFSEAAGARLGRQPSLSILGHSLMVEQRSLKP